MTLAVGIFLFDQVEVLDFAGPFEVFSTAARVAARDHLAPDVPLFSVFTISASRMPVRARAGLTVVPDYTFEAHPVADILLIPGGVVTAEQHNHATLEWIANAGARAQLVASVCTGAFLLAQAGLLDGLRATTHWEDASELARQFPLVRVQENCRWVDEGTRVSSGGIAAGIDMCLHLVERFAGRDLAERTARQMDVDWRAR